jgi:membrane protease subunit HflC
MVTTFVCWKVADPYKFYISSTSTADAENKLRTLIETEKKNIIARFRLSDLVNTDPAKFRFEQAERDLRERTDQRARQDYGMEVVDVGIRLLSFPKGVTEQIFDRMKKSEENKAAQFEAEGIAEGQAIRARASAISENIMAVADRLADEIRAQAQSEVGVYYAEFDKNPQLRLFLDRVEAVKLMLKERSTLIIEELSTNWLQQLVQPVGEQTSAPSANPAPAAGEPD